MVKCLKTFPSLLFLSLIFKRRRSFSYIYLNKGQHWICFYFSVFSVQLHFHYKQKKQVNTLGSHVFTRCNKISICCTKKKNTNGRTEPACFHVQAFNIMVRLICLFSSWSQALWRLWTAPAQLLLPCLMNSQIICSLTNCCVLSKPLQSQ